MQNLLFKAEPSFFNVTAAGLVVAANQGALDMDSVDTGTMQI